MSINHFVIICCKLYSSNASFRASCSVGARGVGVSDSARITALYSSFFCFGLTVSNPSIFFLALTRQFWRSAPKTALIFSSSQEPQFLPPVAQSPLHDCSCSSFHVSVSIRCARVASVTRSEDADYGVEKGWCTISFPHQCTS